MKSIKTGRGFVVVLEEKYQNTPGEFTRLIGESSAVGDYDDSWDLPGSSFLWIGNDHHLNREQVRELIDRMEHWLQTKRLAVDENNNDESDQPRPVDRHRHGYRPPAPRD